MPRRPTRAVLSPSSRRMVAGLLIAAGILLVIGQLLRVYVLVVNWRALGFVSAEAMAGVGLGLGAGVLTSYIGWRVGRAG
jgi:Na+-transporting NADH:ubiquinone oxidoreductase subunit NqrD